ncbi:MAG: hypothetical protein JXD22_05470 [Sedimentisphaerales bacterium]|nr:hypothetical protein [Sedimentisphaerales bacterium]
MAQEVPKGLVKNLAPLPAQPGEDTWKFVADLQSPLWSSHGWSPRAAASSEADLQGGISVDVQFPNHEELLRTAYADFSDFLAAGKVPQNGPFVIEIAKAETTTFEAYRIEVTSDRCRILAADTEGIRRGIFYIEDMMLRAGGPFLPLGTIERKPFIKSRISRCFFGPINRPPRNRDELMDDVDYYPDQYLNRIAHEGINGLWLSVQFKNLCKTSIVPEFGKNAERQLDKLRKTVEKCRRYGIRVYIFAIEPASWTFPASEKYPELIAANGLFCPGSEAAQKYLYEATNSIFAAVPHLGGMINISFGERQTTCLSSLAANINARTACPVCAKKEPGEILRQSLSPMARGIHDANPDAELIAWLYMPGIWSDTDLADWVYEIPKYLPDNVVLQFNFESGVVKEVFGRGRKGGDYWLSTPGPSPRFERMAYAIQKAGSPMSAKIQTGCSHELATVPFVPVPGNLYRKFRAMHELGVTHVMLCWYFGNYPGVMNKAVGELSFEPFPKTEDEFLHELASTEWGKHTDKVVQAWRLFAEGYGNFPLTNHFQYYGPMHDGVVWPLLLRPQNAPLTPTWQISVWTNQPYPPSGDRIGDCLGQSYTLAEAVESCRMMSDRWDRGVEILQHIDAEPALSPQRRLDIGIARALGIQFHSGLNILRFYDLRERMTHEKPAEQLTTLKELRPIVEAELKSGKKLIELCRRDSRLGFHSEAEGYKYFPEKIRWRMNQLQGLLDTEIPSLERMIERGEDVFAEYTGRVPTGPTARSLYCANIAQQVKKTPEELPDTLLWQKCSPPTGKMPDGRETRWACCHDREAFYLLFNSTDQDPASAKASSLLLTVEPQRLWPCLNFSVSASGAGIAFPSHLAHLLLTCDSETHTEKNCWQGWMRIPFVTLGLDPINPGPLRINVQRTVSGHDEHAWITRRPWPNMLLLGNVNPEDLGWLFFEKGH